MTKSLAKAIALATVLGASASAHAVNVNPDGLGEVLLYSVYTSEQGNVTTFNVTNTSDYAKAVKVRFVEGMNSQEVLDFNLYLSAHDQWSGAVTQTPNGAKLITADKSCTAPAIPTGGVDFRSAEYQGDSVKGLDRTRVGHIEIIEMGTLDPRFMIGDESIVDLVTADHSQPGTAPTGCNTIVQQFKNGVWKTNINAGFLTTDIINDAGYSADEKSKVLDSKGSLYGSAAILNIEGSTQMAYDAVAIDNFLSKEADEITPNHALTGSVSPSLNEGANKFANFKNGETAEYAQSVQAVSAVLMKESINNDFVLDEARGSETNWVVTFPTKRYHVNGVVGINPFVKAWDKDTSTACNPITIKSWDNEEYRAIGGDIDFSPAPAEDSLDLCYETNIVSFNGSKMLGGDLVTFPLTLAQPDFRFGWMNMEFAGAAASTAGTYDGYYLEATDGPVMFGLPAIGFSGVTIKNNKANNGVMNNYGSAVIHKSKTTMDHILD